MSGTGTISAVVMMVGVSATLGVAHQQGWGAFGEFEQSITRVETCKPQILHVGWSSGAGSRALAEASALIGWSKRAHRTHGDDFGSWHNAQNRNIFFARSISAMWQNAPPRGAPANDNPK